MVVVVAPSFRPPSTGSPLSFSKKKRTLGRGAFFFGMWRARLSGEPAYVDRLLTREEGESGQQADCVGSSSGEAMLVVGFKARCQPVIREWKLEPHSDADVPGIRAISTRHTDPGDADERPEVKVLADAVAVGDEQKAGFEIVSRDRIAPTTDRIDAEPRLELELVTEEIAEAEYLRRERKQSAARITNSEREAGVDSQLDRAGPVTRSALRSGRGGDERKNHHTEDH